MSSANPAVGGIHHVTVIAGDPQQNVDFYTGVLGLRLVKKTVNQDVPDTYHLFYADGAGTPGTDLTFFPWPQMEPGRPGAGLASRITLAVPKGALPDWRERLVSRGVEPGELETQFEETVLPFWDPHGLPLALVESDDDRPWSAWARSVVPEPQQIRGMHSVRMSVRSLGPTRDMLLDTLGFREIGREGGWLRLAAAEGGSGTFVDVLEVEEGPRGRWGTGSIHHVAWIAGDAEDELALREEVRRSGLHPTEVIDRFWFQSVYFREPGGVLFELATDGPGFTRDETIESLGAELILPPWLEGQRAQIEAALPKLAVPA